MAEKVDNPGNRLEVPMWLDKNDMSEKMKTAFAHSWPFLQVQKTGCINPKPARGSYGR
ncbi:MAG: hypothetical protein ACOC03_05305 [Desulfosalsimonas sp.]